VPASSPRSLCLIRLSALGDVCHTVAMVRALQSAWPDTAITWVIGEKELPLVQHLTNIHFIVFDKSNNVSSFRRIRKQCRNECFDVLVLAQTSFRANCLSLAIRAKRRIGFSGHHAKEGHALFVNESMSLPEKIHQAEAIFAFAPYLLEMPSLRLLDVDRALPITEEALAFAREHQPKDKDAVLISPCSSHSLRNWSGEAYAKVADWISENTQRPVILIGGPSDRETAMGQSIEKNVRHPIVNLIGKDTIDQALAMLQRAKCVISPDSGPAHMADGLGTPVVGLYAATRVQRSGPWASIAHCVDQFPKAAKHFRKKSPAQLPWGCRIEQEGVMALISPEDVIEKLAAVLKD